jgi:hypothetical protein
MYKNESDSMEVHISSLSSLYILEDWKENVIIIKEKTPSACFSQFMAVLLLQKNPETKKITVHASKAQNKSQLEETLKNMNFQSYAVIL